MPTRFERELTKRLRDIGKNIADARLRAGLSQEQAADAAQIDARRWQRLEAGKVNMTYKTLFRISQVLGAEVENLVS